MTADTNSKFIREEYKYFSEFEVCGVDEAGRGPIAGPLSLSFVSFSEEVLYQIHKGNTLQSLDDSKKLSQKSRELLYYEVKKIANLALCQLVSNKLIDNFGLNYSIYYGIQKLLMKSKLSNPYLLIDGNYNFDRFDRNFDYISIIKGDTKVASIAAASIVAKVERDWFMQKISEKYPQYEFEKHKGYGTKKHIEHIKKYGYCRIHRRSFVIKGM